VKKRYLCGLALIVYIVFVIVLLTTAATTNAYRYQWHRSYVTTYSVNEPGSSHTEQGCVSYGLKNWHRTFAARNHQVPAVEGRYSVTIIGAWRDGGPILQGAGSRLHRWTLIVDLRSRSTFRKRLWSVLTGATPEAIRGYHGGESK
jgi:hypothetical protein